MNIGMDLSSLQGPHRMRGIGYTLINTINGLPLKERKNNNFIFYVYRAEDTKDQFDPLSLLNLSDMKYEVRFLKKRSRLELKLPGKLKLLNSIFNNLIEIRDLCFGDSRINNVKGMDVFLQTDQSQSLPRNYKLKKYLVLYDIIPYALEWDYLWSYDSARKIHGFSRKAAFRCGVRRWLYGFKLKLNCRRAVKLLAISKHTKMDFVNLLKINPGNIEVTPLGVNELKSHSNLDIQLKQYVNTSWGYIKRPIEIDQAVPFILFVGGADKRRKIDELVTAFNKLRAENYNIKLILAGDSMQGPDNIATEEIQGSLKTSSYLKDIVFMGFIDDDERDWLYRHALAFVFPSRYEGFGLPVLEAMIDGCPVISYKNAATNEVAGDTVIYAAGPAGLTSSIKNMLGMHPHERQMIIDKGIKHAKKYSWSMTAYNIISHLE